MATLRKWQEAIFQHQLNIQGNFKYMKQEYTALIKEVFPVGPLACNCCIIGDPATKTAMVVDPGGDAEKIFSRTQALELNITALICTHAHFDHFLAAGELHEKTGAPIYLHREDKFLWDNLELQCQLYNVPFQPVPEPQRWLCDDQILPCCNGITLHTPGHTPGSVSFLFEEAKLLIAGDTLFRGSIGRTDLWGGDFKKIEASIRQRLYTLSDDTLVVTGHGRLTTIGHEKASNSAIRQ